MPASLRDRINRNFADPRTRILVVTGVILTGAMLTAAVAAVSGTTTSRSAASLPELQAPAGEAPLFHDTVNRRHQDLRDQAELRRSFEQTRQGGSDIPSLRLQPADESLDPIKQRYPIGQAGQWPRYRAPTTPHVRVPKLASQPIRAPLVEQPQPQPQQDTRPRLAATTLKKRNDLAAAMAQLLTAQQTSGQQVKVFIDPAR